MTSCGLVMKEDITQPSYSMKSVSLSCGLVMKEDITQQQEGYTKRLQVVVW